MNVSTIPTVKTQLVTLIDAATDVQTAYCWPGANTEPESVFLGYHPGVRESKVEGSHEIATIKSGRKQRQEEYELPVTVWSFRPELTAADGETAEARGFVIARAVENVLADDSSLGLGTTIQWSNVKSVTATLEPYDAGWVSIIVLILEVRARLT